MSSSDYHSNVERLEDELFLAKETIRRERKERESEGNHHAKVCDWVADQLGYAGTDELIGDFLRSQGRSEEEVQARVGPVGCPGKKRKVL